MKSSKPYVIAPVELIVVLYKKNWKKTSGSKISNGSRDDFMAWTNGLWTFNGESKKDRAPCTIPHRTAAQVHEVIQLCG